MSSLLWQIEVEPGGRYHEVQTSPVAKERRRGLIDSATLMTPPLDRILATLNSADVGALDRIAEKMSLVAKDLRAVDQEALAAKADDAVAALGRADVAEFKRLRAFIQSKVGHLR